MAADADATAIGAAALAGLGVGVWPDAAAVGSLLHRGARYEPSLGAGEVAEQREAWRRALRRATTRA